MEIIRDLAEAKHEIYTKNNRKYYLVNVRNETKSDDYVHFIERYLRDQDRFEQIIEELYHLLKEYQGCYILSDRPYKDSKVLFYRYGEILPIAYVDSYGTTTTRILDENNNLYLDKRTPFFQLPPWVKDKYQAAERRLNSYEEILSSEKYADERLVYGYAGWLIERWKKQFDEASDIFLRMKRKNYITVKITSFP